MFLTAYRRIMPFSAPFLRLLIAYRVWKGREEPKHKSEREGVATIAAPKGTILWVHAASVGEMQSILPLVRRVLEMNPQLSCLVTTVTVTAARMVRALKDPRILHQYVPFDCPAWVGAFLDHWKPGAAVWVESELWPNTLDAIKARGIPLVMVNGRVSARSAGRWSRHEPRGARRIMGLFDAVLAQSDGDAARLNGLGASGVVVAGNMKYSRPVLPYDEAALSVLQERIGARPVVLFASTHDGEEEMAARIYAGLAAKYPNLLFVIMPRHATRGDQIASQMEDEDLIVTRRSKGQQISEATNIYLADTMGEPGVFFRLAPIVYIGNSLISSPGGGHNPIEAAQLGCAIIYGPHMWNFAQIDESLRAANAALLVHRENELARAIDQLLANPAKVAALGGAAKGFVDAQNGVLDKVAAHLRPVLSRAEIAL